MSSEMAMILSRPAHFELTLRMLNFIRSWHDVHLGLLAKHKVHHIVEVDEVFCDRIVP